LCQEEHTIPKSGFKVNKRLQRCLEIQFNTLKLTPIFNECKTVIKKANEKVTTNEVIQSIEDTQANYIKISKQVNQISTNIEQSKKELDHFVKRFDTFDIDEKKFEDIKQRVVGVNKKFDKIILDYNNALIGNKEYSFEYYEISIADVFGRFYDKKYVRHI
jgi:hypothetical protein